MSNTIYHFYSHTRPGGGPPGYLYNIDNIQSENIEVLVEHTSLSRTSNSTERKGLLSEIKLIIRDVSYFFRRKNPEALNNISDSKIIFHSVTHAARYINSHKVGSNKVYYMSHSPVPTSVEWSRDMSFKLLQRIRKKIVERLEKKVLSSVSGVICPNKSALEAYYIDNASMRLVLDNTKLIEIPTGCKEIKPEKDASVVRNELGFSEHDFIVSYLGRYNKDKGYENYRMIVEGLKNHDIKFISAGIGELERAESKNYIDLGWRTDAADIINASDIIVVPNNVAYFDLIILECLSLGKRVVTTYVGGSKELVPGVVEYLYLDSNKNLPDQFLDIKNKFCEISSDEIKQLFNKNYSTEAFRKNLEESLNNE